MPMRKMNLRRRVAKKQRGSGFSFGVDQPQIAGQPEVVRYSDCGSVNTPTPMNQSVANVVGENAPQGCAPASNTTIPASNTVNAALNSTLSRTLNTSLTTLIVLTSIFIFGGESIRGFMFALIIGVIVGTYSSVFIATPIMFDSYNRKIK